MRPKNGQWVRIKNGLYQDDLGYVDKFFNDQKIYVKLVPRIDPNLMKKNKNNDVRMSFMKVPQCEFNPANFEDANKIKPYGFTKHFYQFKTNIYRKGFIYKPFSLKQIDSQNIKPTLEEREHFLEVFNNYAVNDNDSSDMDTEETRNFYRKENGIELSVGDKVYVKEGELQKAYGTIVNFDQGGSTIVFKPLNLEGFTDNLDIERSLVVKYFEQGDPVRVVEGNYQGETGVVMNVDEDNIMMPIVKIDST